MYIRHNNYVDDYLQGINLYNYQVYALKLKEKYWTPEKSMCLDAHE